MSEAKVRDRKDVAAVCGAEVLIFGGQGLNGVRPFKESQMFGNHGQALTFAVEFDEKQRAAEARSHK